MVAQPKAATERGNCILFQNKVATFDYHCQWSQVISVVVSRNECNFFTEGKRNTGLALLFVERAKLDAKQTPKLVW
jgi:hypothetical protein